MASLRVRAFDHEGRPIQFDTWLDDLQLYLLSDSRDSVSLFDHMSGAAPAPPATADSATHSQTTQALYDAVVARYSSPATAALGRLLLPYLFPELSAFATVEDLVSHLRTSGGSVQLPIRSSPPLVLYKLGQVAPPCSCRLLSHQTLHWHHCLGHPSLPRLRGMHSRLLVSGLPRSLPSLPLLPAPPCLPCVEGRQRAAPHTSSFPPASAPLQTLHIDVWSPARVSGQGRDRSIMLVVDDYTRYTTVFPLRSKSEVRDVLIPWIRAVHLQLGERFGQDLPVLHLHSDRGGEFSSDLLRDFCRGEGITHLFSLSDSPQKNGIGECRIGLVPLWERQGVQAEEGHLWLEASSSRMVRQAGGDNADWGRVEEMLEMQFKCSKMGDVKYYLGMHVERDLDKGVLRLHQRKYCEGLAEKYGLQDGGKPATPLPSGFTVEPCADEELEAAKRLVRYVSAIASVGLEYSVVRQRQQRGAADLGKGEMLLTCYTDASFNSMKADGTSIGGYVCLFGGGAMSWRSKKQNEVGLSSFEMEYMVLHHGVKEVVWLRRLLEEIGVCQRESTMMFCDNESAVKLVKNACLHGLTKHIRPKWHWVRRLLDKEVRLEIVKTRQQAAAILTKRLAENEHWKGMKLAGMSVH
ncbi:unnamed protein product [Closterium sp. NIES-53]